MKPKVAEQRQVLAYLAQLRPHAVAPRLRLIDVITTWDLRPRLLLAVASQLR